LLPFRSPLLRESLLLSFPLATKMFQFARLSLACPWIQQQFKRLTYSGISGSMLIFNSPKHFVACYALPRLWVPRAEIPEVQEEQAAAAAAKISVEDQVVSESRIEDIPPEHIEPVGHSSEVVTPSSRVASVLKNVLDSITSTQAEQDESFAEVVASGHNAAVQIEDAPAQGEQEKACEVVVPKVVAPRHHEDIRMDDAPVEGEHFVEKEAEIQGEPMANPHVDQFKEGVLTSPSESDEGETNVEHVEPIATESEKGKGVASTIPLLTRKHTGG
ncbi:hypothetical protein Taro_025252, partial [Colocasia esculenta]|nr:hypothetical protein [Colocasia esculenta]